MKKITINQEELEMMNYNDIAHLIIQENGKKMRITDLFNEVSGVLGLNAEAYQSHIADFFELLSTDKRFIMLDDGYWDLKIKHNKGMESFMDEDDEEEEVIVEDEDSEEEEFDDDSKSSDDDVDEDDFSDLVIVDDIEEDSN